MLYFGLWDPIALQVDTKVSEKHVTSIYRAKMSKVSLYRQISKKLPLRSMGEGMQTELGPGSFSPENRDSIFLQNICIHLQNYIQDVTTQKTTIRIVTTMKTSKLPVKLSLCKIQLQSTEETQHPEIGYILLTIHMQHTACGPQLCSDIIWSKILIWWQTVMRQYKTNFNAKIFISIIILKTVKEKFRLQLKTDNFFLILMSKSSA